MCLYRVILLKLKIAQEECCLVKDAGTCNTIFMPRNRAIRTTQMLKDVRLFPIDYAEVFDELYKK